MLKNYITVALRHLLRHKYVSDAVRLNLTVELAPVKTYYLRDNNFLKTPRKSIAA